MARRRTIKAKQALASPLHGNKDWKPLAIAASLVALTWIVFGQTLGHEFVNFDDPDYVSGNSAVQRGLTLQGVQWAFTHVVSGNWHPLTILSHMLDVELFSLKSGAHHFTNVLLHTAAVVFLFLFFFRSTSLPWRSAFVAALFAIHPLRAESVAWISERKDVLSGLFFMLTLWAYRRYAAKTTTARYLAVAGLFACGLLSKPMLVSVPVVLLLLDYWPLARGAPFRRLLLEKLPLAALSAASALATLFVQGTAVATSDLIPMTARLANAAVSCFTYIRQLFWPFQLAPYYPHPKTLIALGPLLISLVVVVAISLAVFRFRQSRRYLATGWLWYLVTLLPVLGIIQVGQQAHADRYTYLPHLGLYVMIVWAIGDLTRGMPFRRQILVTASALALGALATRAWGQTAIWRDSEKLWRHALAVTERNYVAHRNLAATLWSKKAYQESIEHDQAALRVVPYDIQTHNRVGLRLMELRRPSEAIAHWKKAIEIDPGDLNAQSNLAWVFATCPENAMRDGRRAVEMAESVVARGSRTPVLLRTLAAAYAEAGRYPDAIVTLNTAIRLAQEQRDTALAGQLQLLRSDFELGLPLRDSSLADVQPMSFQ